MRSRSMWIDVDTEVLLNIEENGLCTVERHNSSKHPDFELWTNPRCEAVSSVSIEPDCIHIPFSSKETLWNAWEGKLEMDATSKMKILYGIAAAMKYIYSQDPKYHNLVDLHPTSILLTEDFEPKVLPGWPTMVSELDLRYGIYEYWGRDIEPLIFSGFQGRSKWGSKSYAEVLSQIDLLELPHRISDHITCMQIYSLILLRMHTKETLLKMILSHMGPVPMHNGDVWLSGINRKDRYRILREFPPIPDHVNDNIRQLIESCQCNDKSRRPSFNDIKEMLRTQRELWLDGTNEEEFLEYIKRVDTPTNCTDNKNEEIELMLQQARLRFTMNTNTETSENISDYIINGSDISVLSSIGSGSFGSVNLCNLKSHPCYDIFAVKSIDFRNRSSAEISDYFMRETEILAKVHHPCTLSLCGVVLPCEESPGQIVTEFLRKGSLADVLEKVRSNSPPAFWTPTNIALIATGIAMGMRFVHKKGIWHRDLKPANILLDENYLVRIADFGCSRFGDNEATLTQNIGTPYYMAPEISDSGEYDHRVDVYAFGLILFEILTGERVFRANLTQFGIIKRACDGIRPKIPKNIHPEIQQMIKDCWAVDPQIRPSFDKIVEILVSINFCVIPGVSGLFVQQYYLALDEWEKKYT